MAEAAAAGSKLVIFPEAYLPGYPTWIWRLRPGGDMGLTGDIHARLHKNAVDIAAGGLDLLCEGARKHGLTVVCGMSEVDSDFSGSTLYNTVVTIGPGRDDPQSPPQADAYQPRAHGVGAGRRQRPQGRRHAGRPHRHADLLGKLHAAGALCALRPEPRDLCGADLGLRRDLARHHAPHRQGGRLLGRRPGHCPQGKDVPDAFPSRDALFKADDWLCDGDAVIVEPSGKISRGPCTAKRAFSTATSIRPRHHGPAGRWTSPATTRAPTSSAWM